MKGQPHVFIFQGRSAHLVWTHQIKPLSIYCILEIHSAQVKMVLFDEQTREGS